MPEFEEERLTAEEAERVARLHAERLATERERRERLAETTLITDVAGLLDLTPEEVRDLALQARSDRRTEASAVRPSDGSSRIVSLVVVAMIALLVGFTLGHLSAEESSPPVSGSYR